MKFNFFKKRKPKPEKEFKMMDCGFLRINGKKMSLEEKENEAKLKEQKK